MPRPRLRRRVATAAGALALMAVAVVAAGWVLLRGSLPRETGDLQVTGLGASVAIDSDSLGIPTVTASSLADAYFGLGFVHGRDRFFQMDLLRRMPAGELAGLLGRAVLRSDREVRVHRFRDVARRAYAAAPAGERVRCEAYARGVHAGLGSLRTRPFEYFLLRARPEPWRPEDSYLVILAMFLQLQDANGETEAAITLVHEVLPDSLAAFVDLRGTEWDAPLDGSTLRTVPTPTAAVADLRQAAGVSVPPPGAPPFEAVPEVRDLGSNSFAVLGSRMADGNAWVAGDMHLPIAVPNFWYRAALVLPRTGSGGELCRIVGVTLPGAPAVIAGTNGDVAWAFTNSETDASDLIVLEPDSSRGPETYRTPQGPRDIEIYQEALHVRGGAVESLRVQHTIWGPVVGTDVHGRRRALRWTAHDPAALNLALGDMTALRTVDDLLRVAPVWGIPAQNVVAADRGGHIGWTVAGVLPRRTGFDGRCATSWASGARRWNGWLDAAEYPRIVDPPDGVLCTANQRCVGGQALERVGDGAYALGARAHQIREAASRLHAAQPADLLHVQLDDRALFLQRWQGLLLAALDADAVHADPRRRALRSAVEHWGRRATVESVGYRAVRTFRGFLLDDVFRSLAAPCVRADPKFNLAAFTQREETVWRLLTEKPPHLLDPRYADWRACVLAAADSTLGRMAPEAAPGATEAATAAALASRTWGARNTTHIRHPLSAAAPVLAGWLDMPRHALPGDSNMPRVQWPAGGASQRMVISPGQESRSLFHMPCGQSGHPLSPHYRDGHAAWEQGAPATFLPGAVRHRLRLIPALGRRATN